MIGGGGWKALLQSGGGKGLYAGVWGNLAGVAPSSALFMAVYEPVKQWVYARTSEDQQFWGPVVAGECGGWRQDGSCICRAGMGSMVTPGRGWQQTGLLGAPPRGKHELQKDDCHQPQQHH